jgi:hypothetical protein
MSPSSRRAASAGPILICLGERADLRDRRNVGPAEFVQLLTVLRTALALDVEEEVPHKNAPEMHVGTQAAELDVRVCSRNRQVYSRGRLSTAE